MLHRRGGEEAYTMARILVVDDNREFCKFLMELLGLSGHEAHAVHTLRAGLACCATDAFDIVLLDLGLPDGSGLTGLPQLLTSPSAPEVIIITGSGDLEEAEQAFKSGAWDFIAKPLHTDEVRLTIARALQYRAEKKTARHPRFLAREEIVGESPALKACLELVAQAAVTDAAVLIAGETGVGKELIARAIHQNSDRAANRFVVVDCASLPESLIESALFGHEKGAFTGADCTRPGLIKQAEGGTLFLDEVGELPAAMQKTFLRVLQERRFRPIGGAGEVTSDFRLVSATNRDLDRMVTVGQFRKDLFYRLRGVDIHVPPLRERIPDIRSLVINYLERRSDRDESTLKGCAAEVIEMLKSHDWPGNVRELLNVLDHALAMAGDAPTLYPIHLPARLRLPQLRDQLPDGADRSEIPLHAMLQGKDLPPIRCLRETLIETVEKEYLAELMRRTRGQIKNACRLSELSESRLHALLKKYDIPRFRDA